MVNHGFTGAAERLRQLGLAEVEPGPQRDIVLVNAAAAIVVSGMAGDFPSGISAARLSLESGAAYKKLEGLIRFSGGDLRRS